jgi:5-methylcytosine-specific restriction enzyme A
MNGKILNQKWDVRAKHALYRKTGDWYHRLKDFPGALFDANGYVLFKDENEFLSSSYLQIKDDVHVPNGISNIPNYTRMSPSKPVNLL